MPWDNARLERLESIIRQLASGKSNPLDVPFYLFLYEPDLELQCINEFEKLAKRLYTNNISTEIIRLNDLLIECLREIDSLANLENFEREDRNALLKDLASVETGLPMRLSKRLLRQLASKDVSHCVILLRASSLFPFVHPYSLLSLLEGRVKCIIVTPYPGIEGELFDDTRLPAKRYHKVQIV